jgi:hypothetical protein
MFALKRIKILLLLIRSVLRFFRAEIPRGTLWKNFKSLLTIKEIAEDMCWAELLGERAGMHPERNFILFEE